MKSKLFLTFFALTFMFLQASAQTETPLGLNEQGVFQLPAENLKPIYTLTVESLEFNSLEEGVAYFADKNTEYALFRPNPSLETATLILLIEKRPDWSIADWNDYLSTIALTND
jgi:hypothetical protein